MGEGNRRVEEVAAHLFLEHSDWMEERRSEPHVWDKYWKVL